MICGSEWQRLVPSLVLRKLLSPHASACRFRLSKSCANASGRTGRWLRCPIPLLNAAARAELVACLRQQPARPWPSCACGWPHWAAQLS